MGVDIVNKRENESELSMVIRSVELHGLFYLSKCDYKRTRWVAAFESAKDLFLAFCLRKLVEHIWELQQI